MRKPFLVLSKVKQWYIDNFPDKVVLAIFEDGTIPVTVEDDGVEEEVYLSFDMDENEQFEIEIEMIDDLRFRALILEDLDNPVSRRHNRIYTQPSKDSWIEWREV
jgi:hypothetical protein